MFVYKCVLRVFVYFYLKSDLGGEKSRSPTIHFKNNFKKVLLRRWQGAHKNSLPSSALGIASFLLYCSSVAAEVMSLLHCGCDTITHTVSRACNGRKTNPDRGCCDSRCHHDVLYAQIQSSGSNALLLLRACV